MNLRLLLILPVVLGLASGENLLTNGDFEQDISVGWTLTYYGYGMHNAERAVWRHPDPDYEVWVQQNSGEGWTRLEQQVSVPGPNLDFSFTAKLDLGNASSSCWPVPSVILEYYDASNTMLGETRFYLPCAYCNWVPSDLLSLIPVGSSAWMPWSINVLEEIQSNLPGVDADEVRKITVALYDYTSGG